jgi:hypothetical protein
MRVHVETMLEHLVQPAHTMEAPQPTQGGIQNWILAQMWISTLERCGLDQGTKQGSSTFSFHSLVETNV